MIQLNGLALPWILDPAWENQVNDAAELKGKWSVLLFFNIGCAGCTGRAIPFARELLEQHSNINIVAIHTDFESSTSIGRLQAVADYFTLPFPLVRDLGKETYEAYSAEGTPHWFILDPEGNVQKHIFGSMGTALQRIEYTLLERA